MKKSIKISALVVLLTAGIFTTVSAKETKANETVTTQQVSFAGSKDVSLNIHSAAGSMVKFYDQNKNLLLADRMPAKANGARSYNLGSLDDGNYMVTISENDQNLTKKLVVYEDAGVKSFFIVE